MTKLEAAAAEYERAMVDYAKAAKAVCTLDEQIAHLKRERDATGAAIEAARERVYKARVAMCDLAGGEGRKLLDGVPELYRWE